MLFSKIMSKGNVPQDSSTQVCTKILIEGSKQPKWFSPEGDGTIGEKCQPRSNEESARLSVSFDVAATRQLKIGTIYG
jgi:hypothetical protein